MTTDEKRERPDVAATAQQTQQTDNSETLKAATDSTNQQQMNAETSKNVDTASSENKDAEKSEATITNSPEPIPSTTEAATTSDGKETNTSKEEPDNTNLNEASGSTDDPTDPEDGSVDDTMHTEEEKAILKRQTDILDRSYSSSAFLKYASRFDLFVIIVSMLCAIANGAALPLMTVVFGGLQGIFQQYLVLETLTLNEFKGEIGKFVLYFVYLAIGTFIASYISTVGLMFTGERITDRIRKEYLESCLRQNIGFFDKFGTGEFTTKITADTITIQDGISDKFGMFVTSLSTFVTGFVIGFIIDWKFAFILSSTLFALILTGGLAAHFILKYDRPMREAFSHGGTFAEEVFASIRVAIAFGTQTRLVNQYDVYLETARTWGTKHKAALAYMTAMMSALSYLNYGLGFWQGSTFLARRDLSLSDMIVVMMSIMMGTFNMSLIGPYFTTFLSSLSVASKMFSTIDRESPLDPTTDEGKTLPKLEGHIRLENIKHVYPSRPNVTILEDLSLEIPAGKVTALVGSSGCGKSTIVGLVERFYEPIGGKVFLDGHDTSTLNLKWMRQQMALVGQEPTLFAVSIFENIRVGLIGTAHENADEEKQVQLVEDAARMSNAHDFILQLPEGYQTNVGQRGFLLSGGQKQRIAIARAIVSNPKVLLLDEATSALDTRSEGLVQKALDNASTGRTTITIAHRLSTIRNADNIIVMNQGKIVEQGTHDDLISREGAYHALVTAQKLEDSNRRQSIVASSDEVIEKVAAALGEEKILPIEKEHMLETETPDGEGSQNDTSGVMAGSEDAAEKGAMGPRHSLWEIIKFIAKYNRPEWSIILIAFFFCVLCGLAMPVQAVFFAFQIVTLSPMEIPGVNRWAIQHNSNFWSLMFLMLGGAQFITNAVQGCILGYAAERLVKRLRNNTFKSLLRQDVRYFDEDNHNAGALTAYLAVETTQASGITGTALGSIIQSVGNLIAGLALSLVIGWKLALVCFAAVPLAIGCGFFRWWVVARHQLHITTVYADSASFASENISAIKTVASLTREQFIATEYSKSLDLQQKKSIRSVAKSSLISAAAQSVQYLCYGLGFWYGSTLMATLEYSMFQFFVCFMAMIMGAQSAGSFFSHVPDFAKAQDSISKLKTLIEDTPLIDTATESGEALKATEGHLEFRDVIFRYPTRPMVPVLRGLSFKVEPGKHVALVGSSGCGKSTTISLLERFYDPLAGQVLVDGKDVSTMNINDYRSHIALVSQEPTLFQGTIRENICMGTPDDDVSDATIERACREANIYDFVASLPDGFNTIVGSRGGLLSTGQKQRVAIARALIRSPKILLLDEATSALDSESETVVQAALDRAAKGRTTVTVAHRLSTIQHADMIHVFDLGRIVESGTHKELMELNGAYAELVRLQSLEKKENYAGPSGKEE